MSTETDRDYEKLVERLNAYSAEYQRHGGITAEAADAIEALLAERDAAVGELRGLCWCCANGKKYENGLPWSKATTCEHMRELGVVARSGGKCKCQHWQWRGQQKEGGDG